MEYVVCGYFQDDPFGKKIWNLPATYFGSVKRFLEAEKSIRVKSLIIDQIY